MKKFLVALVLSSLSLTCFSKTVKENEFLRAQNVVALFNKACMEAYLDEDELSSFLTNNEFEDLNDESEKNLEPNKSSDILNLSSKGKHYSIINDKRKFFLDITDTTCSVLVENIQQEIFNNQFKDFRKSLTSDLFVEHSKSLGTRKGSINYKVSAYFYSSADDGDILPFEIYLVQSNEKSLPYQLKLSVHLDNRKETLSKKQKKLNASHDNNSI